MRLRYAIVTAIVSLVCVLAVVRVAAKDGDTVYVKTLTFKDTTKRSGTWLFPPRESYEKVVMLYTLKCDPATTQDRFPCGEWDYLTYTMLRDSTGEFDSTRFMQPNYRVRGGTPDSFLYRSSFVNIKTRFRTDTAVRTTAAGEFYTVGPNTFSNTAVLQPSGGRVAYTWTAKEMKDAGMTAGLIHGLKLSTTAAAPNVRLFTIRLQQVSAQAVPKMLDGQGMTTVVRRDVSFLKGDNHVVFTTPFAWDGASDLMIEVSCAASPSSVGIQAGSSPYGASADKSRKAYRFTAGDAMVVPGEIGASISDEVTVSFWCYGDANKFPRAHNTFEAYDAQGRRVLNVHLPWDNQTAYWDAGIDPKSGAYDRIEKATPTETTEGRWNHWAFVKTKTGVMRMYCNGVLLHEGNGKTRKMSGITKFLIGTGGSGSYEGLLDEFQVWNVALDEATIKQWMHRQISDVHPQYTKLIAYYNGETDTDPSIARDASISGLNASLFGVPTLQTMRGDKLGYLTEANTSRPAFSFEQGTGITSTSVRIDTDIESEPRRTSVVLFERNVEPRIYRPDAEDHPSIASDTILVQEAGYLFTYDENGFKVDSTMVPAETTLRKKMSPYFSPVVDYEISRYITPYGIGLDLGPNGFRWEYDVTDFAPLLRGNVTLSAGNQQELIDLTFMFIKGTPPRSVKQIDQVVYERGAYYPDVITNKAIVPVDVALHPEAKTFRLKAVTSGHEFSNNTNCAEFCQREHFISIDGTERFNWILWKECATNPVYPQGGTWLIDRTGWCPGEMVDLYDWEATQFMQGKKSVTIDYGVKKKVAEENWGRWEVSTQLIGYGAPNFSVDASIADVISPNNWEYYSRLNPICGNPVVVLQNTGATDLSSCTITYGAQGSKSSTYQWTGKLKFLEKDTVTLPLPEWPSSQGTHKFVASVNLDLDGYTNNNSRSTNFVMPPSYYDDVQIQLRTNRQAEEQYEWRLRRVNDGKIIGEGANLESEKLFTYDFKLEPGCYDFELINKEDLGLDFWFYRDQLGTGSLLFKSGGQTIKTFEPDFGRSAWAQFVVAPKPTILVNTDTVKFELASPGRLERTFVVRSGSTAPLRVDSMAIFSVRKHFSLISTSVPLPVTLEQGDSIMVTLAFERPDAGLTSGSIRVYCNDERNLARQVRLIGTVGTTGVDDETEISAILASDIVPHPVADQGTLRLQVYQAELLRASTVTVRDLIGQTVAIMYRGDIENGEVRFDIPASLASGSYTIAIESEYVRHAIPLVITR
ncbi:MAG: peptide-N-glycosidase F-related protein [Ignavibacteria bacterium]